MRALVMVLIGLGLVIAPLAFPETRIWEIRGGSGRAVEEGMVELTSPRFEDREQGRRRLVSLGDVARPALTSALTSPDPEVRKQVALALRTIRRRNEPLAETRHREFIAIVHSGLRQPGGLLPGTRLFEVLSFAPDVATLIAVDAARRLEDRDAQLHQRAVRLIRDLADPAGANYLAELLHRGWILPSTLHFAVEGLLRMGDETILPALRATVASPDPFARAQAVRLLGVRGHREDLELLAGATRDPESGVRREAARALALRGGREALPSLERLAADPDAKVRLAALVALTDIPGPAVIEAARGAASDPDPGVRGAAVSILGRRGGEPRDVEIVKMLLEDPSPGVRSQALRARFALGARESAVQAGLSDPALAVRRRALLLSESLPVPVRREIFSMLPTEEDPFLAGLREAVRPPPDTKE